MRITWLIGWVGIVWATNTHAQVAELNWELDYEIYMKMANDSNYTYDIRDVFHITDARNTEFTSEFVFYPVMPGDSYAASLAEVQSQGNYSTLWSALNAKLGGGWVHFINCISYALEMQVLNLQEPIMKRPVSNWKPNPVTETWKRTHKWGYYIPISQKDAQLEYKTKQKEGSLGDLKNLPASYLNLFETTHSKAYARMKADGEYNTLAKIDLVKVILGANYLGEEQINYLSNAVLNAVKSYSQRKLPSVLVFDEFDAAAAMTLSSEGYHLESVVFKASAQLSSEEMEQRKSEIQEIVATINAYNKASFQKRLQTYYQN